MAPRDLTNNVMEPTGVAATAAPLPMELIQMAVEKGQMDSIERLMDLQERWEANAARKAYFAAMAQFKQECPGIEKRGKADRYEYPKLEDIQTVVTPILSKHGLSVSFDAEQGEGTLRSIIHISHVSGHVETRHFTVPIPKGRGTNAAQDMGAANSYARRYGLANALDLRILGVDNDGHYLGVSNETISPEQAKNIEVMLEELGGNVDRAAFLRFADAASVAEIKRQNYDDVLRRLDKRRAQVRAAAKQRAETPQEPQDGR